VKEPTIGETEDHTSYDAGKNISAGNSREGGKGQGPVDRLEGKIERMKVSKYAV